MEELEITELIGIEIPHSNNEGLHGIHHAQHSRNVNSSAFITDVPSELNYLDDGENTAERT